MIQDVVEQTQKKHAFPQKIWYKEAKKIKTEIKLNTLLYVDTKAQSDYS